MTKSFTFSRGQPFKSSTIFKGKAKPTRRFVGINNAPTIRKDKFGELWEGNVRDCPINTRWGQLNAPYSWMGKKIRIVVIAEEGL